MTTRDRQEESRPDAIQQVLSTIEDPSTGLVPGNDVVTSARELYRLLESWGVNAQWVTSPSSTPMIVAGDGPVLLITYFDGIGDMPDTDRSPLLQRHHGIAAAIATLFDPEPPTDSATLVIETDRHRGSLTIEHWLEELASSFRSALWSAIDLPLRSSFVVHSACGLLTVRARITPRHPNVQAALSGVIPDVTTMVTGAVAGLTSHTHEVLLDGFYEGARAPDEVGLKTIEDLAPEIDRWLTRHAGTQRGLTASHATMGLFFAPSLHIRELSIADRHPLVSDEILIVIECKLVPGQSTTRILEGLNAYLAERIDHADVKIEPILTREPVAGRSSLDVLRSKYQHVLPVVPGYNPASIVEAHALPSIGYTTPYRQETNHPKAIDAITSDADFIGSLVRRMHRVNRSVTR